jgi:hypothetical protein
MRQFLAAALAAAVITGPAAAQPAPPQGEHGRHDAADREQRFAQRRQQRIDDLKAVLRIRPDQEAAWSSFTQAEQTRPFRREGPPPDLDAPTPQRLATLEQRLAAREAAMRARIKATLDLYAALSPEQQKVFDALQRLRGRGRMGPPRFGQAGGDGRWAPRP